MNRLRKTTQHILPVSKESHGIKGEYDIYPTHDIGEGKIHSDYASLARSMAQHASVTIDGYGGVRFDLLREGLDREFAAMGIEPVWWSVGAAMKPEEEEFQYPVVLGGRRCLQRGGSDAAGDNSPCALLKLSITNLKL